MDQCGMPLRITTVREMAGILAAQRIEPTTIKLISKNWVRIFIKYHSNLQSKFNRKYDYQRAKCKDPILIQS